MKLARQQAYYHIIIRKYKHANKRERQAFIRRAFQKVW